MFRAAGFSDSEDSEFDYYNDGDSFGSRANLNASADLPSDSDDFNEKHLKFFWKKQRSNFCDYLDFTPGKTLVLDDLRFALKSDNVNVVQKFFKSGISSTDKLNERGWTSLDYAVFYASNSSLLFILRNFKCTDINSDVQAGGYLVHKDFKISQCLEILNEFQIKCSGELITFDFDETQEDFQPECKTCPILNITSCDATQIFLSCIQLPSLIPIFKNFPFHSFLLLKDEDLQRMGVPQFGFRKHILGAIDQFHKCQWDLSSIGLFGHSVRKLSGEELVAIFKNLKFQLKVMESSMEYAKRLITENQSENPKFAKDIEVRYIKIKKNLQNLYDEVVKFRTITDKVYQKLTKPPHLIEFKPGLKNKLGSKWLAVVWLSLFGTLLLCWSNHEVTD